MFSQRQRRPRLKAERRVNRLENIVVRSAVATEAPQEGGQDSVTVYLSAQLSSRIGMLEEGSSFIGYLTTKGRVTGRPHTVLLRLVCHRGKVYASRSDAQSDWCRNLLKNPNVTVEIQGQQFTGTAQLVTDEPLCRKISELKYRDQRALEKRTVIEITLTID